MYDYFQKVAQITRKLDSGKFEKMARKVKSVISPGKGGVKHDIKKPIAKTKKPKPNIIERIAKTPVRSSSRRTVLADIKNEVMNSTDDSDYDEPVPVKKEKIKPEPAEIDDGMCEYERIRMKNILERQALLNQLDIKIDLDGLTPVKQKLTPSSRGLASEKKEKVILPPRKSARLAGGLVPEIDRFVPIVEEPEEAEIANLDVLEIADCFNNADNEDFVVKTKQLMTDLCKESKVKKKDISFNDYDTSINKLSITEELVAKVVPDRIFSVKLNPGSKLVAAVGGKAGHVGLWDVLSRDSSYNDGVHVYQPHQRPVNTLTWDISDSSRLVSTSYDGTSR